MPSDHTHDTGGRAPFQVGDWHVEPDLDRISRGDEHRTLRPRVSELLAAIAAAAAGLLAAIPAVVAYNHLLAKVRVSRRRMEDALQEAILRELPNLERYLSLLNIFAAVAPLLLSGVVNLHPVAIVIAVLLFGGLWGLWGLFFAIPLATLLNAVIKAWFLRLEHRSETP